MAGGSDSERRARQPHDALFRMVLGKPEHAASELRAALPPGLLRHLDLERLTPVPGSFVDATLRHRHTDALFSASWSGRDGYLYIVIEHQSTPDALMAFRMLRYQLRIWESHLSQYPEAVRLPVIVPLVIYQGSRPWSAATDLAALLDVGDDIRAEIVDVLPRFEYLLDDLSSLADAELRARPLTPPALGTFAMLRVPQGSVDVTQGLTQWAQTLREVSRAPDGREVLTGFLTYLWEVSETPEETLLEFIATVGPEVEEVAMSTAEKLRAEGRAQGQAEGRAQGQAEGRAQGQAEMLTSMLELRFGPLDEAARLRIDAASPAELAQWSAQLVDGTLTLDVITG